MLFFIPRLAIFLLQLTNLVSYEIVLGQQYYTFALTKFLSLDRIGLYNSKTSWIKICWFDYVLL